MSAAAFHQELSQHWTAVLVLSQHPHKGVLGGNASGLVSALTHPHSPVPTQGRIFMTHATKAIYYTLLSDFAKLASDNKENMLFDKQDVERSMDRIEVVDFDQTIEVEGMKVSQDEGCCMD